MAPTLHPFWRAQWVFSSSCVLIMLATLLAGKEPPTEPPATQLDRARDRAKVLHAVLNSTLKVIHRRYFHEDRAVIPARAMEDIFDEMKHEGHFEARWIAVNLRAMGIDHEPANDFEKKAAEALKEGKTEYETFDQDTYRRAAPIPLRNGCIGCHEGGMRSSGSKGKMAALVISIPLSTAESEAIE
jgi:hypothetical protein